MKIRFAQNVPIPHQHTQHQLVALPYNQAILLIYWPHRQAYKLCPMQFGPIATVTDIHILGKFVYFSVSNTTPNHVHWGE